MQQGQRPCTAASCTVCATMSEWHGVLQPHDDNAACCRMAMLLVAMPLDPTLLVAMPLDPTLLVAMPLNPMLLVAMPLFAMPVLPMPLI
eukprot:1161435-Pelagomonas_calceolata.AAC.4